MRITPDKFEFLLQKISHPIQRKNNYENWNPCESETRTLSFLATGYSYRNLSHFFRVSKLAISLFVPEVLDALYECLMYYIKISIQY